MNRLKSFLACVLTLSMIGMTSMSALAEGEAKTEVLDNGGDGIFLSDIEWKSWYMFESSSEDSSPKYQPTRDIQENEMLITIGGITYLKGLRYHPDWPQEGGEIPVGYGDIVYDIGSYGCTRFYSVVGKDSVGAGGSKGIQFQLIGDGKVLAESEVLFQLDYQVFDVDITGVQELTLRCLGTEAGISNASCAWGNTQIYKNKPSVPKATEEAVEDGVYLSDIDWASWSMFESKSTDATPKYQPTKDIQEDGNPIVIGGVHYPKGLRYHPDQPGEDGQGIADITYDLTSYNYTRFDAIVGKDSVGAGGDRTTKIKFQVLGDNGEVLAESPELTNAQAYAFSKVDIEGVNTLTLRCLSVDDIRDDSCAWGNAKMYKTSDTPKDPVNSGDASNTDSKTDSKTSSDGTKDEGGIQPWVIVVIVVAVVAVVAVVVFVVVKKKKAAK